MELLSDAANQLIAKEKLSFLEPELYGPGEVSQVQRFAFAVESKEMLRCLHLLTASSYRMLLVGLLQSTLESRLAANSMTPQGQSKSPSAEARGAGSGSGESTSSSSVRPTLNVSMPFAELAVPCRYSPLLPKLIFLDLHMPVLDGFQAALAIRRMGFDCPIIALTASVGSADQRMAEQLGFLRYLTKPISRMQLKEALQIAVQHADVATSAMQRHVAQAHQEKTRQSAPGSSESGPFGPSASPSTSASASASVTPHASPSVGEQQRQQQQQQPQQQQEPPSQLVQPQWQMKQSSPTGDLTSRAGQEPAPSEEQRE